MVVFGIDSGDVRHAQAKGGRTRCLLCKDYFNTTGSAICPGCITREPTPIQDNEPPDGGWLCPREAPEIVVARAARIEAEQRLARYRLAVLTLHQTIAAIAGAADRPLRLLPRDQHRVARLALEQFRDTFPDIAID